MNKVPEITAGRVVREKMRTSAAPEDVYGAFADPGRRLVLRARRTSRRRA
jgi:hypothetical protein